jgi:hypothetical protein
MQALAGDLPSPAGCGDRDAGAVIGGNEKAEAVEQQVNE